MMICVGLDLGAPLYRRDPVTGRMEYFGPMVNRAAQLCSQARAGEVLATSDLADAAGSQGPLGWVGMGARELVPGSGVANRVLQLVHSALPVQESIAEDPTRAHRTNLPSPDRAFTGRSTQLAELNRLFNDQARWTTVVGTAGVGKSRLVQEAARRWLPSCPGGVWWCELAAVHDLDGLLGVDGLHGGERVVAPRGDAVGAVRAVEAEVALAALDLLGVPEVVEEAVVLLDVVGAGGGGRDGLGYDGHAADLGAGLGLVDVARAGAAVVEVAGELVDVLAGAVAGALLRAGGAAAALALVAVEALALGGLAVADVLVGALGVVVSEVGTVGLHRSRKSLGPVRTTSRTGPTP